MDMVARELNMIARDMTSSIRRVLPSNVSVESKVVRRDVLAVQLIMSDTNQLVNIPAAIRASKRLLKIVENLEEAISDRVWIKPSHSDPDVILISGGATPYISYKVYVEFSLVSKTQENLINLEEISKELR